jgi:hypothetical protein
MRPMLVVVVLIGSFMPFMLSSNGVSYDLAKRRPLFLVRIGETEKRTMANIFLPLFRKCLSRWLL